MFSKPRVTEQRHTNFQVFQIVCNIQNIITRIPGQVERQQPVYLIDALGKIAPFHLEFVRSTEVLTVSPESALPANKYVCRHSSLF